MLEYKYVATPFLAWLVTGCAKFAINSMKEKRLAFDLIGYGGMPSNHASIASAPLFLLLLTEGLDSPAIGIAVAFLFIVLLDASSLRREVQKHAIALNQIDELGLRERIGHTKRELFGGCVVGGIVAYAVFWINGQLIW